MKRNQKTDQKTQQTPVDVVNEEPDASAAPERPEKLGRKSERRAATQ